VTTPPTGSTRACRKLLSASVVVLAFAGLTAASTAARADAFLDEIVDFTGSVFFLEHKVLGLIIGAVSNGDISVHGYGERAGEGSSAPDGNTVMRLGSIRKAFTGQVLAALTVDGTVQLAQPLRKTAPEFAVHQPLLLVIGELEHRVLHLKRTGDALLEQLRVGLLLRRVCQGVRERSRALSRA
jgi:CubicO group peptidase (beta-lactamase class C family)